MTVRTPLYWNGDQMQEMKSTQLTEQYNLGIYYYSLQPSVALSVSGSGGNLTSIDDTRLQAGAASTASGSFPSEATTAEPSVVTTSYQRITQTLNSVTPTSDTGVTFPVYWNGTQVQAMTQADFLDTFVIPAINLMALGDITVSQGGTYHDQPTTVTNYYLHKIEGDSGEPSVIATFLDSNNDMKQFSSASLGGLMAEYIQQQVVSSSTGYTLRYNVDGSGNTRGTAMVNTILTGGSGNYQQLFASGNDYRAQEFPDGSPSTANTYNFKILKA